MRNARMCEELIIINMRHKHVKMHICARAWILKEQHTLIAAFKQCQRKAFNSGDTCSFSAADCNAFVGKRQNVSAFNAAAAVKIIKHVHRAFSEILTVFMNITNEESFAHARRHTHCGNCHARAEAETDIASEVEIGQGIGKEGIILLNIILNGFIRHSAEISSCDTFRNCIEKLIVRYGFKIFRDRF